MKKFLVFFTAVALVCGFGIPAMAADEAPAWNFYGSARMATWYDNTSDKKTGSFEGDDTIGPDDSGTIWNLQGNSRFGATVKGETIGGGFEYGTGVNLRKLYGTYTMGAHEFLVGQTYTPLAYRFYSNQAFATDDGLLAVGNMYTGRDPMLQWKMGGLRVALVKPVVDDLDFGDNIGLPEGSVIETDADSVIPQLEARYVYRTDMFALDVFGGVNTYNIEEDISGEDDTVTAYTLGLGGEVNFGPGFLKAQGWFARNGAQLGTADVGNASAQITAGGINDNDGYGVMGVLGFKATDSIVFEGGIGFTSFELDKDDPILNGTDETIVYYVNAIIDIVPGFFIVPEFGYYDFMDNMDGEDEGSETYFGAKWQINF